MKKLSLFLMCLILAACAHRYSRFHGRGLASVTEEDEVVVSPAHYNIFCGALLPASEHFELSIRKGSSEAVIVHNDLTTGKPFERKLFTQRYAVKLVDARDSYIYSGAHFELRMLKSDYTTNGQDTLVPSHLKAEFQGKKLGIESPNCVFEEAKN